MSKYVLRKLLTDEQVAELLNVSTETLRYWRKKGRGPEFVKLGRQIRYTEEGLAKWIESSIHAGVVS